MKSKKIRVGSHTTGFGSSTDSAPVYAKHYNELIDDFSAHVPADGAGRLNYLMPFSENGNVEIISQKVDPNYVTGTVTLTKADSGKVFWIQADNPASDYILPAANTPGITFKFVWVANNTNAITITTADITDTTGDMLRGGLLVCSAAAINTFVEAAGNINRMTFDDNVANSASGAGSWVELTCVTPGLWSVTGVMNGNTDVDGVGSAIFSDVD